jgi:hypothetical protein
MQDSPLLLDIWKQVNRISDEISRLKHSIAEMAYWGRRIAVLLAVWAGGLLANMSNDQLAELAALLIRKLTGG